MKIIKRLGLVGVAAGLLAMMIALALGSVGSASTPPDPTSCYCTMPVLSLSQNNVYWESPTAYALRTLSVDFEITNSSSNYANAHGTYVTSTVNSGDVVSIDNGRNINMVAAGECELFTMKYNVPFGVSGFQTTISAEAHDQCGNFYNYGG
jgi:hypothetical protein